MKTIPHFFNEMQIDQLLEDTTIAKFVVPRGYVNVTQMCKAAGKRWSNYTANKSAKAYWEALSAV